MEINTPKDWWELLNSEWNNLFRIFNRFLSMNSPADPIRYENGQVITLSIDICEAKVNGDHTKLLMYLNDAWWHAPDKPWIHDIPGWSTLCDLCSEKWVFEND